MAAQDMDELFFNDFELSLGRETRERIQTQISNYDYYHGKQHKNEYGALVRADELERPDGLDYDPTRYATNYFKAIINRKARWQMGGEHGVQVKRRQIDDLVETLSDDYEPSAEQLRSDELAEGYEKLLHTLWDENRMRSSLVKAARDRLIADRAVCKIVFNPRTGKLRWIWRPDTEFIPIYSDDDFEDLIACHFIKHKTVEHRGVETLAVQKQTFRLIDDVCWVEEAVYRADDLELVETITEMSSMQLDFIPVVTFPVDELLGSVIGESEVEDLRTQNDVLNQMNEDAIDSLKFEMFPMTAVLNAPPGTAEQMRVAPGAVLEARGSAEGMSPDVKKVESGFRWKEAFKDQYMRVKGAMHEVSGLPQIVPQELNFGGLNSETLRVMFHDIISDTEEHWLTWEYGLEDLHDKSMRYLQARVNANKFAYDKEVVRNSDEFDNDIHFVLPLPDNRKELVELLADEMANDLESQASAMERLGVENVTAKKTEIDNERRQAMRMTDPYGDGEERVPSDEEEEIEEEEAHVRQRTRIGNNGEEEVTCPVCGGSGLIWDEDTGESKTCSNCRGDGWYR